MLLNSQASYLLCRVFIFLPLLFTSVFEGQFWGQDVIDETYDRLKSKEFVGTAFVGGMQGECRMMLQKNSSIGYHLKLRAQILNYVSGRSDIMNATYTINYLKRKSVSAYTPKPGICKPILAGEARGYKGSANGGLISNNTESGPIEIQLDSARWKIKFLFEGSGGQYSGSVSINVDEYKAFKSLLYGSRYSEEMASADNAYVERALARLAKKPRCLSGDCSSPDKRGLYGSKDGSSPRFDGFCAEQWGCWDSQHPDGTPGTFYYPWSQDSTRRSFIGYWQQGKRKKLGASVVSKLEPYGFPSMTTFQAGEFEEDWRWSYNLHTKGEVIDRDHEKFWKLKDGYSVTKNKDGTWYYGAIKDGQPHNRGVWRFANNDRLKCTGLVSGYCEDCWYVKSGTSEVIPVQIKENQIIVIEPGDGDGDALSRFPDSDYWNSRDYYVQSLRQSLNTSSSIVETKRTKLSSAESEYIEKIERKGMLHQFEGIHREFHRLLDSLDTQLSSRGWELKAPQKPWFHYQWSDRIVWRLGENAMSLFSVTSYDKALKKLSKATIKAWEERKEFIYDELATTYGTSVYAIRAAEKELEDAIAQDSQLRDNVNERIQSWRMAQESLYQQRKLSREQTIAAVADFASFSIDDSDLRERSLSDLSVRIPWDPMTIDRRDRERNAFSAVRNEIEMAFVFAGISVISPFEDIWEENAELELNLLGFDEDCLAVTTKDFMRLVEFDCNGDYYDGTFYTLRMNWSGEGAEKFNYNWYSYIELDRTDPRLNQSDFFDGLSLLVLREMFGR